MLSASISWDSPNAPAGRDVTLNPIVLYEFLRVYQRSPFLPFFMKLSQIVTSLIVIYRIKYFG